MFKYGVFLTCFLFSMSVQAAFSIVILKDFELWTGTYGDERIRITGTTIENPENCADTDSYIVDMTLSEQNKARVYSTLLAAVMSYRSVRIVLDGCQDSRPKITTIMIN